MRKQQAQGLELNGKFLIFLLYSFCFAFFSFEFSRNVLLKNLENHELLKADHWDKKICLEALFFSPFGRDNHRELEGIPGWRPEVTKYHYTFQLQVSLGSKRKVFMCWPACFQLPFTSGGGRASVPAWGPSSEQPFTQSMRLIGWGSQKDSNFVRFSSRTLLHNHS